MDIDNVQAKLQQLEVAVANHRESMKEIEQLAFGNDAGSQQAFQSNDVIEERPGVRRPLPKFYSADDTVVDSDTQIKQKVCSASFGIEEAARSKLDVRNYHAKHDIVIQSSLSGLYFIN